MLSSSAIKLAIPLVVMSCIWLLLLFSVLRDSSTGQPDTDIVVKYVKADSWSGGKGTRGVRGYFNGMTSLVAGATGSGGTPPKLPALPYVEPGARAHVRLQEPPSLDEVRRNITTYLGLLHARLGALSGPGATGTRIWETFLDVTSKTLITWDDENKDRFPAPRADDSIFVSVGSYRDEYCPMTLKSLYSQAHDPEKVFVGLFQQNCFLETCTTGVLQSGAVESTGTDVNCYDEFCSSAEGRASGACLGPSPRVRLFNVNESESLGPYMARYFGAKLYRGEAYYLQIDSHSEFATAWDSKLLDMMALAPAARPVISTYPPGPEGRWQDSVGNKICDSEFAASQIEWQIVRLEPSRPIQLRPSAPLYAPFVAAGFLFARGSVLHDVPFDPLLPWIFMGEEISMSARLWTSGYDLFSPSSNVLNHYYVRRHKPKFWETVNRYFDKGVHNDIVELVIRRVKHMLGYPECAAKLVQPPSLLHRLDRWSMGRERSFADYMKMVGLDPVRKVARKNEWCAREVWPDLALRYQTKPAGGRH